jgi:DnaJ-class molecular chaperone
MHLKIPNQGMPKMNSGQYGDQFIVLKTFIPDRIDDEVIQSILSYKNKGNIN